MLNILKNLFGSSKVEELKETVRAISALEPEIEKLTDAELKEESLKLKIQVQEDGKEDPFAPLEKATVRAFALVREAARRTLKQRPYDVQLIGGLVLHGGAVAEMMTGEGKTLAAVAPAYLNALAGKGVHVVTVNEYLARRDAVWMGQVYKALGLSVACLVPNMAYLFDPEFHVEQESQQKEEKLEEEVDKTGSFLVQQEFLRPISRREAYLADITYGTNHEFGFDYLRDNLAYRPIDQVQRQHYFAIIDEVDSILIDEARTPLIIAAPDAQSSDFYKTFARVVSSLQDEIDYTVDEKHRSVAILPEGIEKVEKMVGVTNIYSPENIRLVHYLEESLKAKALFKKDKDYVVKNGEIFIVDEFTGRLLQGRRYNGGLHQAIEAKEGVHVQEESKTYAKISIQNYFRMYKKISGMTGTAQTSAEEFFKVYNLEVISIPSNKPLVREDRQDLIYKTSAAKWNAVVNQIKDCYEKGQPVLVGTTSIEKNEIVSALLSRAGIAHEVLNAKNNEREGAIIAQAGKPKSITVATNMAGRGVDIILGGNPPEKEEAEKVRQLGGLYVLGTERHEARRIDNQLRGRAGRQGDPGASQFFLSLEDDLMRIFGGDKIKAMMERLDYPEDMPIQTGFVSKAVAQAQSKVEGNNFDIRKHLLEYDDVLNKQRTAVYKKRQEILDAVHKGELTEIIFDATSYTLDKIIGAEDPEAERLIEEVKKIFEDASIVNKNNPWPIAETDDFEGRRKKLRGLLTKRSVEIATNPQASFQVLGILDMLWMNNLEDLEALSESVGLRAYGQKDPLVEYRQESRRLFSTFWENFNSWLFGNIYKLEVQTVATASTGNPAPVVNIPSGTGQDFRDVGRNDPCPCGSGKKFKHCHGK